MTRLYFDLDTTFYWPASVLSGPPFIYYFIPYYFLGVFAVVAHLGAGVSAAILPIIAGAYFEIDLPQEWIDYLLWYVPSFEPGAKFY